MKTIEYNNEKLTNEEIEKTVKKVRAILINDKGQCLLVKYAGLYMLPGGKVDEGEQEKQSIEREIFEETGILIDSSKATEFLRIKTYDRNYYDRYANKTLNRITDTVFYEIHTQDKIHEEKKHLTQSEKDNGLKTQFINLSKIPYLVETNKTDNPKRRNFDREILVALKEYREFKTQENEKEKGI